jgi:PAS domain S-box-containing protein
MSAPGGEARFRTVADLSPDAIVVLVRGRIAYANPAAARALGYSAVEELLLIEPREFLPPEELATMMARIECVRRGERLAARDYMARRKDGSSMVMEITSALIQFEGNEAVLAFGRDMTERRMLEARLEQQDRLASIGTLAAGVAHEMNNPLAYVLLHLQRLQRALPAALCEPERDPLLRSVNDAIEGTLRVSRIIHDLLTFSRRADDGETLVDVVAVCESTRKLVECTAGRGPRIVTDYDGCPSVLANETKLGQVLLNLLLNAAHAVSEHSDPEITLSARAQDDRAVIEVSDNGPGIVESDRERIFSAFFTTKAAGSGTGLGLTISRSIVAALGGSIRATSRATGGAVLRVELPLARSRTIPARTSSEPEPSQRRGRVMVIDDERVLASALAGLLRALHDVEVHCEPLTALAALEREPREFDLVLCDVLMPGLSGTELYQKLAQSRPEQAKRFAFMTGGMLNDLQRRLIADGDLPLLQKPFEIERVLALLRGRVVGG